MKWKYCPFCGSITLKRLNGNIYKCPRCDWEGVPEEGDMVKVNEVAKKYVIGTKWSKQSEEKNQEDESKENEQKGLEKFLDKNIEPKKVPKNKELLLKLKGKDFGDAEFL